MAEFNRLPTKEELSRMLYQMQLGGKSQQDIINENLASGSTIKAIPDNAFQKMAKGAGIAKEQVNKLGNAADLAKMFPGYTGQSQVSIPTGYNFSPKQDVYGGVVPQGLQTQQVNVNQLLQAIKPADVLGITGAQQAYTDVGMGKAPNPMDVLDVAGLGAAGLGAGKGLLGVAKATKGLPVGMSIKDVSSPFSIVKRDASDTFGAGAERVRYIEPKSGGSIDVLVRPDQPASVMSLEVPEAFRGKKIGESLQAKVLQDFPEMQGQVSSKAAAKTAYRLGRRPMGDPNASIDDVFKMIDDNSSVNMVSPQMQNKASGLLGTTETSIKDVSKPIDIVNDYDGIPINFYHGGYKQFTGIEPKGRFGGAIFAREGQSSGYGTHEQIMNIKGGILELNQLQDEISTKKGRSILSKALGGEKDQEKLDAVASALTDGSHYPTDQFVWDAIGAIDEADAQIEIQKLRGNIARSLGHSAVRTPDEFDGETVMILNNDAIVLLKSERNADLPKYSENLTNSDWVRPTPTAGYGRRKRGVFK